MARILVVDDNPQVARLVKFKLSQEGHDVEVATDSALALERLRSETPDLCILDILMPGMDGYELLGVLRRDPRLSRIRVIFLTGLSDDDHVVRGLRSGADDYVVKPFSPNELLARVNRLLAA